MQSLDKAGRFGTTRISGVGRGEENEESREKYHIIQDFLWGRRNKELKV